MSLKSLTLTDKTPQKMAANPISCVRAKFIQKLDEQIGAAHAAAKGEVFSVSRRRWIANDETGEKTLQDVQVRLRPWWWKDETGTVHLTLRYGNKPMELAQGKTSILVGKETDVSSTLNVVREALDKGELDDALSKARAKKTFPKKAANLSRKR